MLKLWVGIVLGSLLALASSAAASERFPLSTDGRYIVDRDGQRFKVQAVNWYGAHLVGEIVGGLDQQSLAHIVNLIKDFGFNAVRLPFSNTMLRTTQPVSADAVRANPQLQNLSPLQVFDATVEALTAAGIVVFLNNHSTYSEWCCGYDANGLWIHSGSPDKMDQNLSQWENDWLMLIERYKNNKAVVAADLRNEVRTGKLGDTILPQIPNWGRGDQNDWHKAAEDLGRKILAVNPDILIVVEGINWWGTIPLLGSGSRPHLMPVRDRPVHLPGNNKLVYAAHNYTHIGPEHNGNASVSKGPLYSELGTEALRQTLDKEWGFVSEPGQFYTAPVWVSEFGAARDNASELDKAWFRDLITYMIDKDLDFAYWPLNHESYGLVSADWSKTLDDDWRIPEMKRLMAAKGFEGTPREVHYSQLDIRRGNDQQNSFREDWLLGANKGTCPDTMRLAGMSQDHRALCTDEASAELLKPAPLTVVAVSESSSLAQGDWASGFTKYECPPQQMVLGFSKHYWGSSGILCSPAQRPLSSSCTTRWFDREDGRGSVKGGDFASGSRKGQCADHEYVAGLAQRDGKASALLCCSID